MYSDEETELRDVIMQNLENCGFLNKIKAQVRAGVILAVEEDGNLKSKIPLFNQKFDNYISTSEGKLIISLIREFLEYFNLSFTLSVFEPEVAAPFAYISRSELFEQTNIKSSEIDGPVISVLLKEVIGGHNQNVSAESSNNLNSIREKSVTSTLNENVTEKDILEDLFTSKKSDQNKENPFIHSSFDSDIKSKYDFDMAEKKTDAEISNNEDILDKFKEKSDPPNAEISSNKDMLDKFKEKSDPIKNDDDNRSMFKELGVPPDHDPFFDEPLPSDKTSFFKFSDPLKDKPESKSLGNKINLDDSKKSSLTSLKDLPSLTANHEWTFTRDPKNALPSLDSLKSISSSEASNEEIINVDSKDVFERKDSDIAESNEESSEKQNSEESIEEEIDESSAGIDDILASSLSLADDVTTDQTVSQVSIVEGVDHVEPVNS